MKCFSPEWRAGTLLSDLSAATLRFALASKRSCQRRRLYHALAPLVSPVFPGDDPEVAYLHKLFSQARVWADIVRTRIAGFASNRLSDPSGLAIRFSAGDLLSILTDLLHELRRTRDALMDL